jgi:hypothetical protein
MPSLRNKETLVSPRFALVAFLAAIGAPALAADLPTLPSTADSQPTEPDWKGFYIGSGISLSAIKGPRPRNYGDTPVIPFLAAFGSWGHDAQSPESTM